MAEPARFNPHTAADLTGEGFERLRVMLGRSNQASPGPLCVDARAAAEAAACPHADLDYTCGSCDAILLHAEEDQIHNLTIRCTMCGSYNSTDV